MVLTDIHCHMLPGVDDGAADTRTTAEMLRRSYKEGVRRIIVTPHYRRGMFDTSRALIEKRYIQAKRYAAKLGEDGIELYLGCECFRHSDMVKSLDDGKCSTLAGSRYVLTEFSTEDSYSRIRSTVYELLNGGYIPVIAHAERYEALVSETDNVSDLINLGALIQVNAASMLGKNGRRIKKFCKELMESQEIHFIASDAHDKKGRRSRIGKCAAYVEKKWGTETARRIFEENPSKIIGRDGR